jgi:pimeloyl-ACP methyl ester carboxylesterase
MRTRGARVATLLAVSALVAGCGSISPSRPQQTLPEPSIGSQSSSPEPAFASVDCPDEVAVVMIVVPECGYLTVPERRDAPSAIAIRIFVVRIDPPAGVAFPDPVVVVGETLGARIEYGGLAPLAQRTGRTVYLVDRRGTGLSGPRLDCPEVTAAAPAILALQARAPAAAEALDAAVRACRARLTQAGIDVAAYGLHESALDIEALRNALDLEPWNVIGFGSASRLAIEVGRAAPAGVRTMVLDSPVLPNGPAPPFAAQASTHAIAQLEGACGADSQCGLDHPDVAAELQRVVRMLDQDPIALEVELAPGQHGTLVVDGVRFGRAARDLLASNGGADLSGLLASLRAMIDGRLTPNDPVVRILAGTDPLCLGYVPHCMGIEHGSLLTTICADVLPFVDREAELAAGKDVAGMAGVFETNPFFGACEAWDVEPDPRARGSIETDIPVLALAGQFDPFTGPIGAVAASATGLERAVFLEVPNQSYNIFGFDECPRAVRREWLDDPDRMPDTSCFADIRRVRLSP